MLSKHIVNNIDKYLALSGAAINSMFSYTPKDKFQSFEEGFGWEFVTNLASSIVSVRTGDLIEKMVKEQAFTAVQPFLDFSISSLVGMGKNYTHNLNENYQSRQPDFYYKNTTQTNYGGSLYPFPK